MTTIFELVKDPYERKARVIPGLLVALPVLVPLLCVYGARHPVLTGVIGLLGGCGAIYALASVARGRGKKLEEMLVSKWGGMPTTIALRHRDKFLDGVSKQRYHTAITAKLGIAMPTAEEESANPDKADDIYIGATKRLRELTRSNKQLLLKENIAYGFHRKVQTGASHYRIPARTSRRCALRSQRYHCAETCSAVGPQHRLQSPSMHQLSLARQRG